MRQRHWWANKVRVCLQEGFVEHAEQCYIRVRRYGGKNVAHGTAAE